MSEITSRPAFEIAELIRSKRCSCVEVLEAHLKLIEEWNPRINAIVTLDEDRALSEARECDGELAHGDPRGPLHGVPVTIKDAFETAGMLTTFGSPTLLKHVPEHDATAVARLRAAGAIILGKSNVPFLCYDWQCRHPRFGRTNNPWDLERTPGGSSGGAAAALAAGITPLEIGSDVAGSIRVPSHFCGVVGMRPTEDSVSSAGAVRAPGYPRSFRNLFTAGPMARTVRDVRTALSIIGGRDPRDWRVPPVELPPAQDLDPRELRIAVSFGIGDVPVMPDIHGAIERLAGALRADGAIVEEAAPPDDVMLDALETWGLLQGFEAASLLPWPLRAGPIRSGARLGPLRLAFGGGEFTTGLGRGAGLSARGYFEAQTKRDEFVLTMSAFLAKWDAWICPVAPTVAFTHRRTGAPIEVAGKKWPYGMAMGTYSCPTALAANPIIVLPIGRSEDGLPIGAQIHGRRWSDGRLLDVAQRIESMVGAAQTCAPLEV